MSNEKRTGLGSVPAGLLRPTTRPDLKDKDRDRKDAEEVVEEVAEVVAEAAPEPETKEAAAAPAAAAAKETKAASPRASRKRKSAAESERVVPWKIYLPESIHFRLRQLAYERGLKLSEAAAEVLDRGLPFYEIVRKDRAG
jgi:16S rRNA C967 or C1407 C5-methylase (RsmB/RsmF family)